MTRSTGGDGNDDITGDLGDDNIDGGAGDGDIVRLDGNREDFTLSVAADGALIVTALIRRRV